jgi:hypothetical protein
VLLAVVFGILSRYRSAREIIEDVLAWAERQQLSNIAADVKGVIRDARNADREA